MSEKKSYNPFKMWGSWMGFIVGILSTISIIGHLTLTGNGDFKGQVVTYPIFIASYPYLLLLKMLEDLGLLDQAGIIAIPIAIIGGLINCFLIGWAIHSLIRKLKKR